MLGLGGEKDNGGSTKKQEYIQGVWDQWAASFGDLLQTVGVGYEMDKNDP